MSREDITGNIAKNITLLRRRDGMTQARLAEELGYSDKSVSKWERGEGVPDIICLKNIAELFGVTVDWLLESEHKEAETEIQALPDGKEESDNKDLPETEGKREVQYVVNTRAITAVSLSGVFLLAVIIFCALALLGHVTALPFLIALPVMSITAVVFNSIWDRRKYNQLAVSLLCISIIVLFAYLLRRNGGWMITALIPPTMLVVWLAFKIRKMKP